MVRSRDIGPCGHICRTCNTKDDCPVTQEQWDLWLAVDQLDPQSKEDAITPARKFYYMEHHKPSENGTNESSEWMWIESVLTDAWDEYHRKDYNYRYPVPRKEMRDFICGIVKSTLTHKERNIISKYLGLEEMQMTQTELGRLYSETPTRISEQYRAAIAKLKIAIENHPRWRWEEEEELQNATV